MPVFGADAFVTAGLLGATAASRNVGATTSGAPTSGTFSTGDWVIAQNGHVWVCTAGGSPGTWVDAGAVDLPAFASPAIALGTSAAVGSVGTVIRSDATIAAFDATVPSTQAFGDAAATGTVNFAARRDHKHAMPANPTGLALGLTGATAATRYVGATASGAPTTGTFAAGDHSVDQTGTVWICTAGGTPGTWGAVAKDSAVVHNTGAESIAGVKTFTSGVKSQIVTSGALSTVTFVSGTGKQISTVRDVDLVVPFTTTTSAGTCKVELSPDNVTYSTLVTFTPAITAHTGAVSITVPAGWYVRLTGTNCTIGTGTFY